MKKSELIKIIKEEIQNVAVERDVDQAQALIKKRTMDMFKQLKDSGLNHSVAKKEALAAMKEAYDEIERGEGDMEKIMDLFNMAQQKAQLAHIGVNNKTGSKPSSAAAAPTKPETPQQAQPQEPKTVNRSVSQGTLTMTRPKYRVENGFMVATVTDSKSGKSAEGRVKIRGNPGMAQSAAAARARAKLQRMISGAQTR